MKFDIARDELLKALVLVQGVVEKRNTMPILSNILLDTDKENRLRITATDLEVGITSLFNADFKEPGKITLNAKNLMEITKQLPSEKMHIQLLANSDVEISCGKTLFKLHGLPPEDFPSLPEVEPKNSFSFSAKELMTMIDHTAFSVSTDETRYNLSGVYLEKSTEDTLRMVSSDGHRLSLIERKGIDPGVKISSNVIIPKKGMMEIRKICAEVEGDLEVSLSKSNCMVQHDDTCLVIRLIDGEFPDYRQVLPDEDKQKRVIIDRETFFSALRRISILSQEKTRGVRFQMDKNKLQVNVNNPDLGEAEEEIEIRYDYPPVEIGFNAKYFMDVLGLLKSEKIEFCFSDSMSQGLIRSEGDTTFKAVIMPMKLL